MKGILLGGILGTVAYFFVFKFLGLKGGTGWLIFFILGIPVIIITNKLSHSSRKKTDENVYKNIRPENSFLNSQISSITKQALLDELKLAEKEFNNNSFYVIREIMINGINRQHKEIIDLLNKTGESPRELIYSVIGNKAGDLLESGQYHVYRGVLNIVGNDLLAIFDKSYYLLLKMNAKDIDIEYANTQKATLRNNISRLG
jgi:hypothetical protein